MPLSLQLKKHVPLHIDCACGKHIEILIKKAYAVQGISIRDFVKVDLEIRAPRDVSITRDDAVQKLQSFKRGSLHFD